jgi:hypothetical protein
MEVEPSDEPLSAAEGVCAFLGSVGVAKSSVIHLVGKGALATLLWFCRHGFEQVAILNGAPAPSEPIDLLLSLDAGGTASLESLAVEMPHVRPGGVVIVRTECCDDQAPARRLLRQGGFRIERRLRGARRDVYVARRPAARAPIALAAGR